MPLSPTFSQEYLKNWGYYELPPFSLTQYGSWYNHICGGWGASYICYPFIESIVGFDPQHMNMSVLNTLAEVGNGGMSLKELQHYAQIIHNDGRFSMYDYGAMENVRRYGESFPPDFNLTRITIPTLIFVAKNDYLSTVSDVMRLHSELLSSTFEDVPYPLFNHGDYIWGNYPRWVVNDKIFAHFDKYL